MIITPLVLLAIAAYFFGSLFRFLTVAAIVLGSIFLMRHLATWELIVAGVLVWLLSSKGGLQWFKDWWNQAPKPPQFSPESDAPV